ncbi:MULTISPECIES: flagellar biosynthesis anti-sigma factor FlgM [Massilia]|uniref:Negative regulator of flagellin synthesis n=2 Tax=Massilia TaxID=149698 RepID=A0ABY4A035_9BURK|nr:MULTISPECIES: flagellar biosynthesis anti-sigma factor FlgM [Massilia]NHZ40033.1 flagellar biosynthesis anti-sigma factor FlgM [Massilia aquatica]UOD27540.1 flagellar biosynthesis anti-sigma factor FlgM [Massilia violaceinigra]
MKISSGGASADAAAVQRSSAAVVSEVKTTAGGAAVAASSAPLQSEVLQPAMAALAAMPDVDHERVAQLRDALAKGELPFDPARLAGLITRFHGGQG